MRQEGGRNFEEKTEKFTMQNNNIIVNDEKKRDGMMGVCGRMSGYCV